jgi:aryl-alcohol dehydrogenase-like predicted oxidoreductase
VHDRDGFADLKVRREEIVIATKVRGRAGEGANSIGLSRGPIMDGVQASVERLQLDHIDLYQIHGADLFSPLEERYRRWTISFGRDCYIGCSNLAAWHIVKALGICRERQLERFVTVRAYYIIYYPPE